MNNIFDLIAQNVILGRSDKNSEFIPEKVGEPGVKELIEKALNECMDPSDILHKGLLAGMDVVGIKFKNGELFVPEVMISADAFKSGMAILEPHIADIEKSTIAKVVIGTVKGDLHDIGKNIVSLMFQGAHFSVVDLGVNVSSEIFIDAIKQQKPRILALSSLLTTTMVEMKNTIKAIDEAGLREQVIILVGGAPVTIDYAKTIGADGFAPDAAMAVDNAKQLLGIS